MPELSRFFGIIIRMFAEIGARTMSLTFHAYYQDQGGIYSLDPIELIAGSLPKRQQRLVEAWAGIAPIGTELPLEFRLPSKKGLG
jgi:hypothetical protein